MSIQINLSCMIHFVVTIACSLIHYEFDIVRKNCTGLPR